MIYVKMGRLADLHIGDCFQLVRGGLFYIVLDRSCGEVAWSDGTPLSAIICVSTVRQFRERGMPHFYRMGYTYTSSLHAGEITITRAKCEYNLTLDKDDPTVEDNRFMNSWMESL